MKKLCKSTADSKIFGVCGGIAEYFNMDPTLVRLGFAVLAVTGAGVAAYIICALVIPSAPHSFNHDPNHNDEFRN